MTANANAVPLGTPKVIGSIGSVGEHGVRGDEALAFLTTALKEHAL